MNEWITDRLPTREDAHAARDRVWVCIEGGVLLWSYDGFSLGTPWQPISKPAPYVKPKRWTVKWDERRDLWAIFDGNLRSHLFGLPVEAVEAAQQIEDIYNKVMP
jgi:hypothetical protein